MSDTVERAWEAVLAHVEGLLLTGTLAPGDRLPGERALALELGVGRSSVREAVRVLEVMGLVRTRSGSGPAAGAVIVARPTGGMSALLRLQVAASGFAVEDVVRTRLVLETAVVDDLARTHRPALGESRELLDAMDAEVLDHDAFLALDAQFHLSLAEASGNAVIAAMTAGLRDAVESYVITAARTLPDWPRTRDRLRSEHRALVAAIAAADPDRARALVEAHISGYYAETHLTPTGAEKD
jgi:DNA-binding FadR family transcriptional regulator